MSGINGVQWARIWAKAWKDPTFKDLLQTNPLEAARQFRAECAKNGYAPFPDSDHTHLLDMGEYQQAVVIFKNMPKDRLEEIIKKNKEVPWMKSKFLSPKEVRKTLLEGDLEIY